MSISDHYVRKLCVVCRRVRPVDNFAMNRWGRYWWANQCFDCR